ncbi:MAG: LacI family DNA-binding transcriptional regulator [Oscillospiraceae bacterium]
MIYKNNKPTIADIAKSVGVSKTTISHYLNGKFGYMSEETRKRIESTINMANYQPNNVARSLKSQKSKLIGVVMADIENPFSSSIIKGAGDTLHAAGYNVIIASSNNDFEKEKEYVTSLISQRIDGLIVNTISQYNPFLINLANQGLPIVLADRLIMDYNFDIAHIENRLSIFSAVEHLFDKGYQRVALFIQPFECISPRYQRRDAFIEKLNELGISDPEKYVFVVDPGNTASITEATKKLLEMCRNDGTPPAILTSNEITLLHIVNTIRILGLKMPTELGLCGFDDWGWNPGMIWPSIIQPGITTLSVQSHNLGKITAELLLDRIADPHTPKKCISLPCELVVRGSTMLKCQK